MTDPQPEPSVGPPFRYRLPPAVAARIRAAAPRARTRHRRTVVVPVICIFGRGARLDGGNAAAS